MKDYIARFADNLKDAYTSEAHEVDIHLNMDKIDADVDTAIPLGLIINELLTNVFKYAFPDGQKGRVEVAFIKNSPNGFNLRIEDSGIGKHVSSSTGFGTKLIKLLTKQLGASCKEGNDNGFWCELIKS